MIYCLAQRNKETGKFELTQSNGETKYYSDLDQAVDDYSSIVKFEGLSNALLLQEMCLTVSLKVDLE